MADTDGYEEANQVLQRHSKVDQIIKSPEPRRNCGGKSALNAKNCMSVMNFDPNVIQFKRKVLLKKPKNSKAVNVSRMNTD